MCIMSKSSEDFPCSLKGAISAFILAISYTLLQTWITEGRALERLCELFTKLIMFLRQQYLVLPDFLIQLLYYRKSSVTGLMNPVIETPMKYNKKIPQSFLHFLNTVKRNSHLKVCIYFGCVLLKKKRSVHSQNYLEESNDPDGMQYLSQLYLNIHWTVNPYTWEGLRLLWFLVELLLSLPLGEIQLAS